MFSLSLTEKLIPWPWAPSRRVESKSVSRFMGDTSFLFSIAKQGYRTGTPARLLFEPSNQPMNAWTDSGSSSLSAETVKTMLISRSPTAVFSLVRNLPSLS